jgi:two-component system, OmpR family, phosphate regulon response regulator PhoB
MFSRNSVIVTRSDLLAFLMSVPGRIYSRQQLLNAVWGEDAYIDERTVDVHVGRLRKVLNRGGLRDPIRTVRGGGYGFDETFSARACRI